MLAGQLIESVEEHCAVFSRLCIDMHQSVRVSARSPGLVKINNCVPG